MRALAIIINLFLFTAWPLLAQDAPKKDKLYDLDESIDLTELKGKLDLFRITRDVVSAHVGALMAIHSKYKTADPRNVGQMVVKVTLSEAGAVDKCKVVKSDIKDDAFNEEIVNAVKQWQFGKMPQDKQEVLIPFFFK